MAFVTEILVLCGFALFKTTPLRQQYIDLISGHFEDLQPELCVFDILCIFVQPQRCSSSADGNVRDLWTSISQ